VAEVDARPVKELAACLADPRRYEREVERLHQRHLLNPRLYDFAQDDVPLATLVQKRGEVSRVLARTVSDGKYRLEPGRQRCITVDGKERVVLAYRLTDTILHGVVSSIVEEAVEPRLSPCLGSYRKGVSWWMPVRGFSSYLRQHRRARPDPRTRGIYVLRRDVDSYTDTIPVDARSALWPMLRELVKPDGRAEWAWGLLEQVVRTEAVDRDSWFCRRLGVTTGQPISCVLFNLYLGRLDAALDSIDGGFYARYSDDILFAHPDPAVAQAALTTIDAVVDELDLTLNPTKSRTLYLTGAGRASTDWNETQGTNRVSFLGCDVLADGTVSLSRNKSRRLLREIRLRARRTARVLRTEDPERVGPGVCAVVNRILDPHDAPFGQRSAMLLRRAVTSRSELAQLDYRIARIVVQAVTGNTSVKAFREVPYRVLRTQWGLRSLVEARNRSPGR
jgi:hypothetical protein